MAFDHGVLNIPNRLRGLDAEIGRAVASQAAAVMASDKERRAQFKADKARAKELLAEIGAAMVAKGAPLAAERMDVTPAKAAWYLACELDQMVKWQPAKFLALADRFRKQGD